MCSWCVKPDNYKHSESNSAFIFDNIFINVDKVFFMLLTYRTDWNTILINWWEMRKSYEYVGQILWIYSRHLSSMSHDNPEVS